MKLIKPYSISLIQNRYVCPDRPPYHAFSYETDQTKLLENDPFLQDRPQIMIFYRAQRILLSENYHFLRDRPHLYGSFSARSPLRK